MTDVAWRTQWVTSKCKIALALGTGASGAGYGDAAIIITSVLTTLAAELWPGTGQDRVRFIECLVQMSSGTPSLSTVSIPLLIQHLKAKNRQQEAETLANAFLNFEPSLVITGADVDHTEGEIRKKVPSLETELLRKFSYAHLIYEEIRCSYAHEYRPGEKSESWPMTMQPDQAISYVNKHKERRIHFHFKWLTQLAMQIVEKIDNDFACQSPPKPATWWINIK